MVVSKILGIKIIILLSVILHCVHCCHLNLKKCQNYTRSCVVVNIVFLLKSIHSSLLYWRDRYLKKMKYENQKFQSKMFGEKSHHIYETYKNSVMPYGCHIYAKSSDMSKAKMYTYPNSDHALPHWKCVLRCCTDYPCINIPDQEIYIRYSETTPSIRFQIYHIIGRCNAYGIIPLKYIKMLHV